MRYELELLQEHCRQAGFRTDMPSKDALEVSIRDGLVLFFENVADDPETMVGFSGTGWHFHGKLVVTLDDSKYMELDAFETIYALQSGELVIVERFINSELDDRWLAHKSEPLNIKHIEPGEELRVHRVS